MTRKHPYRALLWTGAVTSAALAAVALAGRPAAKADAPVPAKRAAVTFTHDVAPILLNNCASCHRPGEIAPFSLMTYEDAQKRAKQIADVCQSKYMPPWQADSHGEFANERKLTPEQISAVRAWADAGAPEGDAADMPPKPEFPPTGWRLGTPDLILSPRQSYSLRADGPDEYRYFVIPTLFVSDRYLSGIEFRAGNTKVVHHIIAFLDTSGRARQLEGSDGKPGYDESSGAFLPTGFLGGWAPGNLPEIFPDGVGIRIPKGADIVLQIHYHKDGKVEADKSLVGLHFCQGPVEKRLRVLPLFSPKLFIPPGEADYATTGFPIPMMDDITIYQVMPHMHLLGKQMTLFANPPGAATKTLVSVPSYDFNWQTTYAYKQPLKLPRGTTLNLSAHYDNSTNNPHNPNKPPKFVTWGEATTSEMCLGFVWFTYDREHLTQGVAVHDLMDSLLSGAGGLEKFGAQFQNLFKSK